MSEEFHNLTAHELNALVKEKKATAQEITENFINRIESVEDKVKSYVTTTPEIAVAQAREVDAKVARGEDIGPLGGVPCAIKDNMNTTGVLTTCASKILHNYKPVYDATVVDRLQASGCICLGKANLDEFAMGSSTENSAMHTTCNPWDTTKVPGGSSGGSAAAVAADECAFALGSDTGGSIRQPASFCGVVGVKPTYGRVSRYGLIAFASSLDQIGPLTKDVTDAALVMNAISGKDKMDSTSLDIDCPDFTKSLVNDVKGLKIGLVKEFFGEGTADEVKTAVLGGVDVLRNLGAEASETSLPSMDYGLPVYYIIAPAECSSNLARFDGVRYGHRAKNPPDPVKMFMQTREEGFGPEVKQRIMIGTYALSAGYYDAYYLKAQKVRTMLREEFAKAFEEYDVLITPVCPTVAFGIGDRSDDPFAMKLADVCTIPVNLAGIPAISVNCGFAGGLPIGMQIIAKGLDEATMLRVAYTFEQNTNHNKTRPAL